MLNYLIPLILAAIYFPTFRYLYRAGWELVDYTHGYFILPVAIWLVWRRRNVFKEKKDTPILSFSKKGAISSFTPSSLAGLGLLIFGVAMLLFGRRMDYLFIKTFSLIPVLFGITLYTRGPDITKTLSFPIAYLLLLVPPPMGIVDNITLPMRYWISAIVTVVLKSFHLPAHREGLLIYLGGHEIFMGQPCSGFRSLVTMTALGLVYAYLAKGPFKKKAILIASIVPFALIGNFLRVLALCLITYYLGAAAGQGFFHNFSGIVIFIVMLIGLIILDRSLGGEEYD